MTNIDKNKCLGCGVCINACPEGIEMSENKAIVKNQKANCFQAAAELCPVDAIILNEDIS